MYEELAQAHNNLRTEFDALHVEFDAFNGTWTDYSDTSTIVGFASYTLKLVYYRKIGNTVFVNVNLYGVSNATNVTFTLPYTAKNVTGCTYYGGAYAIDNGTATAGGLLGLSPNSSTVSGYSTMAGAAWTGSGTKAIQGQFWYEVD